MLLKNKSVYRAKKIIRSLADIDIYKLNMQQAMMHRCRFAQNCEYEFHLRTDEDLTQFIPEIREELQYLCELQFTEHEIEMLRKKSWYSNDYLQTLRYFKLDYKSISVYSEKDGDLNRLRITAKGSAFNETLFEIYVMAIVSEIRNRSLYPDVTYEDIRKSLYDKVSYLKSAQKEFGLKGFTFADFGTRRRLCYDAQFIANDVFQKSVPELYVGTSNLYMANELNVMAIGTQAHEWFQLFQQGDCRLENSLTCALENWVQEYRGELGIALTDIITMDAFMVKFDKYFAKLYDGLRHDSGCPFEWAEKAIKMYERLGIDPRTKTLVFSDGLSMELSVKLWQAFNKYIKVSFGIGTHLTNNLEGVTPLNMVMKLLTVNGNPTAKISDSSGKTLCKDESFILHLKSSYGVE